MVVDEGAEQEEVEVEIGEEEKKEEMEEGGGGGGGIKEVIEGYKQSVKRKEQRHNQIAYQIDS